MTIEEQIAKIEKTINEEYADISEYKELIRKQTAKEILTKIKEDILFHYINSNAYEINAYDEIKMMDIYLKRYGIELELE